MIPPAPSAPVPVAVWEYAGPELKATVIAAGKFHTAIISGQPYAHSVDFVLSHASKRIAIAVVINNSPCVYVADKGELFTWGSSEGGRLGHAYDEVAIAVSNGAFTCV